MSSKLRSLRRNIKKLEALGFVLPSYVKQIRKEQTASKYSQKKLMELSKFKETYKGKERIVSGERGREIIMRERAQKAVETRRRKREERERFREQVWGLPEQARMLDIRIRQYFTQFQNSTLGNLFNDIYEQKKAEYLSEMEFLLGLLEVQSDVIEKLQKAVALHYPQNNAEDMQEAGNDWLDFLTNNIPTMEERQALGNAEDQ